MHTGEPDCGCLACVVERDFTPTKVVVTLPRREVIRQDVRRAVARRLPATREEVRHGIMDKEQKRAERGRLIRERAKALSQAKGG